MTFEVVALTRKGDQALIAGFEQRQVEGEEREHGPRGDHDILRLRLSRRGNS